MEIWWNVIANHACNTSTTSKDCRSYKGVNMTIEKAWKLIKDKAFPYKNVPLSVEEKMALNKMEWLVNVAAAELEREMK